MKTIMITSSGFLREPIRDEILKILPEGRPLRVAYIPTASRVVKDDTYAQRDVQIMKELGFHVEEIDLALVQEEALEARLREGDFIYVQGGNPYWLLKQVRESGFDRILPRLIEEGVPYVGKSAGAYILAPEVVVPEWLHGDWRRFGVEDVKGLGVVPFVWAAHYEEEKRDDLQRGMRATGYEVRAITNDQAFLITGDETRLVGIGDEVELRGERFDDGENRI